MSGSTNVYRVHYHFENAGKQSSPEYLDYVSVAAGDYNSIKTVLSNNSRLRGSGTLVIDQVVSSGPCTVLA